MFKADYKNNDIVKKQLKGEGDKVTKDCFKKRKSARNEKV